LAFETNSCPDLFNGRTGHPMYGPKASRPHLVFPTWYSPPGLPHLVLATWYSPPGLPHLVLATCTLLLASHAAAVVSGLGQQPPFPDTLGKELSSLFVKSAAEFRRRLHDRGIACSSSGFRDEYESPRFDSQVPRSLEYLIKLINFKNWPT